MNLESGLLILVILVFSAILHEIAHGYVADRLGDPTARLLGRLSLDPRRHIDPFMSILLPLIMYLSTNGAFVFGAAKPVPVDQFNLKDGRKDLALVSLSGPLTNLAIAVIASLLLRFVPLELADILLLVMRINILLAIFNLLPIPPLDGSKVFSMLLPEKEANAYLSLGSFGFFILIFLLFSGFGSFIFNLVETAERLLLP